MWIVTLALTLQVTAPSGTLRAQDSGPDGTGRDVEFMEGLGTLHYPVTTRADSAQRFFDQGMRLYYAFNHQEAIRSFRAAQRLDPECAMCSWGEALAWGPNINLPMDSASAVQARAAIERALAVSDGESEKERELIRALESRYAETPPGNRAALDSAWARQVGVLADRYPEDADLLVLHGEALMDLRPWDYWTEAGELERGMEVALDRFRTVQRRSPDHPGACHFFIHLIEKEQPERAVECAERLAGLMPAAGHIVHMPGHIYIRVGRYHDAIAANKHAVHADETYIADQNPRMGMYTAGYYPHNYDFMAFAATMVGREELAIEAARNMVAVIPDELVADPSLSFLQHYVMRPFQILVRFERWTDILVADGPGPELPHARALLHYARGRAEIGVGNLGAARDELESLRRLLRGGTLDDVRLEFNRSVDVLAIAEDVLAGRLAAAERRWDDAVAHLREAVDHEDALLYGEPPEWTVPVRQELGEVLLDADRIDDAARAFVEDLQRFPENGWSLRGLAAARRAQGRTAEAQALEERYERLWGAPTPNH